MEIKTKYSIGDTVYTIYKDTIIKCKVVYIKVEIENDCKTNKIYQVTREEDKLFNLARYEYKLFSTVDDLVKSFNL